jgi:hypothetical protein
LSGGIRRRRATPGNLRWPSISGTNDQRDQ